MIRKKKKGKRSVFCYLKQAPLNHTWDYVQEVTLDFRDWLSGNQPFDSRVGTFNRNPTPLGTREGLEV